MKNVEDVVKNKMPWTFCTGSCHKVNQDKTNILCFLFSCNIHYYSGRREIKLVRPSAYKGPKYLGVPWITKQNVSQCKYYRFITFRRAYVESTTLLGCRSNTCNVVLCDKKMSSFVHPNHTSKTQSINQKIKSFIDILELHLICDKLVQIQLLLIIIADEIY